MPKAGWVSTVHVMVLVLIAVTGVVLNLILRLVETRLCFWSGKATK